MYNLDLQWKEFNISLPDVKAWLDVNVSTPSVGTSANSVFQLHFESEPSQGEKDAIQAYWDGLTAESDEAVNYQTGEQIKAAQEADKAAKIATASTKLQALGLTAEEIQAILGQ